MRRICCIHHPQIRRIGMPAIQRAAGAVHPHHRLVTPGWFCPVQLQPDRTVFAQSLEPAGMPVDRLEPTRQGPGPRHRTQKLAMHQPVFEPHMAIGAKHPPIDRHAQKRRVLGQQVCQLSVAFVDHQKLICIADHHPIRPADRPRCPRGRQFHPGDRLARRHLDTQMLHPAGVFERVQQRA